MAEAGGPGTIYYMLGTSGDAGKQLRVNNLGKIPNVSIHTAEQAERSISENEVLFVCVGMRIDYENNLILSRNIFANNCQFLNLSCCKFTG